MSKLFGLAVFVLGLTLALGASAQASEGNAHATAAWSSCSGCASKVKSCGCRDKCGCKSKCSSCNKCEKKACGCKDKCGCKTKCAPKCGCDKCAKPKCGCGKSKCGDRCAKSKCGSCGDRGCKENCGCDCKPLCPCCPHYPTEFPDPCRAGNPLSDWDRDGISRHFS